VLIVVATRIYARMHFLGYKLKSWYFRLEFVFRVRDQSLKVEDDLRALCLRDLLESTLEMNNLV
jgi:hypothetical protein